jgi:ABC-type nitrate/sulfonate/bicarbonate transport system substrate-binding protein
MENTKLSTVPLNWKEVYYTNCPLVSASNVDQELGWTREEYKKIGVKCDWWRIQEHQGIELMLRMNGMTTADIQIVEFPYPDDWYNNPEMVGPPMENPSELWLKRDHKHDLAFRPLETALEKGIIDALYTQSGPLQQLTEATGKFKAIEDLSRYPDWTLQVANIPATITCSDVMAEKHPELAVAFMKGMIKVGRWANEHKHAAAAILDKQTFYLDVEHTYEGIKHIDMVPNLSLQNLVSVEIGKDFMLSHGYIKHDFDVQKWAAPEFLEKAAKELLEEQWKKVTSAKLPETTELLANTKRVG